MIPAPFHTSAFAVRPDWIDYNGHLNLAYYVMLFDWATDQLWDAIGLGETFRNAGHGTFAAESHIFYRAELVAGETVAMTAQVLGADAKRLHVAHEMRRVGDGVVAAQQELMYLSVSLETRRVTPWPEPFASAVLSAAADHAALARPDWVGRRVAMPSRA
ncbi:MAG TPA: thioesterase family protein [Acetobacteraceae bacterium]|nr:thioesterase family protein [Acetobacteraceae bacterium]